MYHTHSSIICAVLLATALSVGAQEAVVAGKAVDRAALAAFVLDQAPAESHTVAELRAADAQPGDRVRVRAQVGGRNPPWVPGRAMMLLADAEPLAAACTSTCGAPWDFCSAPVDKLQAHTTVVRWLDGDGQPQALGFPDIVELAPLSTVVVTGVVADVGDPRALVIDADGIYLEDQGPYAALMQRSQ